MEGFVCHYLVLAFRYISITASRETCVVLALQNKTPSPVILTEMNFKSKFSTSKYQEIQKGIKEMFIISIIIQCTIKKIALISRISLFTIGNHVFISSYMCRYYIFVNSLLLYFLSLKCFKGALSWYGKLTWESAHALNLIILCLLIVWGMTFIFMVQLNFLCHSIANL